METYSVCITQAPESWGSELATSLGGVLVMPKDVTLADLEILNKRNLPYLIAGVSDLPGPTLSVGSGAAVFDVVTKFIERGQKRFAFIHGDKSPFDAPKWDGACKAMTVAGLDPATALSLSCASNYLEIKQSVDRLLSASPRPEVVIASETAHIIALLGAARERGLILGRELHLVGFGGGPNQMGSLDTAVTMIELPFFEGGRKAAEAISQSSLSGSPLESVQLPHQIYWGV